MTKPAHINRPRTTIATVLAGPEKHRAAEPVHTICPSCKDLRYTVPELPSDYKSQLNPNECRAFAKVVTDERNPKLNKMLPRGYAKRLELLSEAK